METNTVLLSLAQPTSIQTVSLTMFSETPQHISLPKLVTTNLQSSKKGHVPGGSFQRLTKCQLVQPCTELLHTR